MITDIYNDDCINVLGNKRHNNNIDCIMTSPPYNVATKRKDCYYNNGYKDDLTEDEYLDIRIREFKVFNRALKQNGTILYNLSYTSDNPSLPIKLLSRIIQETCFDVVYTITWKKHNAIPFQTSPRKLSRITEMVYVIVRKVEVNTYNVYKEISKINEKTGQKFYKNYVNYIEAKNNDLFKSNHKAAFSTDMVGKLLSIYTREHDIVADPFMGIGTTGVWCINNNRGFVGVEIVEEHYDVAKERLLIQ